MRSPSVSLTLPVAAITYPPRREHEVTTYREAIRAALAAYRSYRELASSPYYNVPAKPCANVPAVTDWYGTDPSVYVFDEYAAQYVVTDRRTYRALSVLLALAPIGGRSSN